MQLRQPKILTWDLEFKGTPNWKNELKIYPGYLLCFACKELDKNKSLIITRRDFPGKDVNDDKALTREILKVLRDVDMHIFHYGSKIDWKFIQTKALQYGFRPLPEPPVAIDTCTVARSKLAVVSNAMRSLADFFGLQEKKKITHNQWNRAFALDKTILKLVEKRCLSDVEITEQFFHKLKSVIHNHPALYTQGCGGCGSLDFHIEGIRSTAKTQYRRRYCKDCGVPNFEVLKKERDKYSVHNPKAA